MRQQTLMSPDSTKAIATEQLDDPAALNTHFQRWMPLFLGLLRNLDGTNDEIGRRPYFIPAVGAVYGYVPMGELLHAAIFFLEGMPGIGKTQIWQILFKLLASYAMKVTANFISKNGEGHRFDLATTLGKRMLFCDETMLGMSYDEARLSDLATGEELETEAKYGREPVRFGNRAKLCISGNHRPRFVSGEAGGLTSRLMLLEAKGENLRAGPKDVHNIASQIVDKEGPAIMMWAIQNAVADYAEPHRFNRLMKPAKAAAREYSREDSPIVHWIEDRMRIAPEANIDFVDAFRGFREFLKDQGEKWNVRRGDFMRLLKAVYPRLKFPAKGRTNGPHPNRKYIEGIGYPIQDAADNVIVFPTN
jgi:P4 family phage/plasmid primase-like protien